MQYENALFTFNLYRAYLETPVTLATPRARTHVSYPTCDRAFSDAHRGDQWHHAVLVFRVLSALPSGEPGPIPTLQFVFPVLVS